MTTPGPYQGYRPHQGQPQAPYGQQPLPPRPPDSFGPYGPPQPQAPYGQQPLPLRPPDPFGPYGPPQPPRRQPPPRKKHTVRNVLLGVAAAFAALVALGAALSSGSGGAGPAASTSSSPAEAASTPPPAPAPPQVIAAFSGNGIQNTTQFTIGGNGNWNLDWTYNCAAAGGQGNFIVDEDQDGSDINGADVNELGNGGSGVAHIYGDSGRHFLEVDSECSWTMKVVGTS